MPKKASKQTTTRGRYPQRTIDYAIHLLKSRKIRSQLTIDQIAKRVGVKSKRTLFRWKKMDMTKKARSARLDKCGSTRLLSKDQESILCGWVMEQNLMGESTTTRAITSFIDSNFGTKVSKQWVSLFVRRKDMSYRTAHPMKKQIKEPSAYQKAYEFLSEIHSLHLEPKQIACLDKTGLYNDVRGIKHIAPKGR